MTKPPGHNPSLLVFQYGIAPVVALLPSAIAYPLAASFGGLVSRLEKASKAKMKANMRWFFGGSVADAKLDALAERAFRLRCCEFVDVFKMVTGAGRLSGLMEVEGLENLDGALAAGNGAVLCGAHFGAFRTTVSLLGSKGYPLTPMIRLPSFRGENSSVLQRVMNWAKMELLVRYTRRPKIPVQSGDRAYDMKTATMAARYLKMNEAVYINIDATVIPAYRDRGVRYGFLGREVLLLPGGVSMASISGAAIHMVLTFRGPDWRHQKVVVSPPFSSKDVRGTMAALLQMLDEAIRRDPSSWEMWDLIPEEGTVFPEMPEGGAAA